MSDDTPKSEDTDESEDGPVGGERLRVARRANDISVRDVAKELHLDEHKVRALERNEFDTLGAPVFAKGHLRKYAELVGVDTDDVMIDYYQMNRAAGAPPVVGPKRKGPRDMNPMPWVAGGVITLLLVAVAYWWFAMRSPESVVTAEPVGLSPFVATDADEEVASAAPAPDTIAPEPTDTEAVSLPAAEPVAEDTGGAVIPVAEAPASYAPTPGVDQVELDLAFTGDCWTEVSDGSGRRLYYALGQEGLVVTLSGDAPLRVILGDAQNVSLTVDGRVWPIPRSAIRGRMARLSIASTE